MRTYKTLGGALAAILSLILTQLIAQGVADLLAMIKLPAGVCNIIAGILYAGLAYAALRLLSEKVLHEHTAALGMPKLHIQPRWAITAVLLPLAVPAAICCSFAAHLCARICAAVRCSAPSAPGSRSPASPPVSWRKWSFAA